MRNDSHNTISAYRFSAVLVALTAAIALTGCKADVPSDGDSGADADNTAAVIGDETVEPVAEPGEAVSILRADIEQPEVEAPPLEPLNVTVGFPKGGDDLDEAALSALSGIIASEQIGLGGAIVLRGHSDAGGNDAANERASLARANAVAAWLVENAIAEDRIAIIAFGEQNPIEPNALPNGMPNEPGRALNRRVEVLIVPPTGEAISTEPGSASALD